MSSKIISNTANSPHFPVSWTSTDLRSRLVDHLSFRAESPRDKLFSRTYYLWEIELNYWSKSSVPRIMAMRILPCRKIKSKCKHSIRKKWTIWRRRWQILNRAMVISRHSLRPWRMILRLFRTKLRLFLIIWNIHRLPMGTWTFQSTLRIRKVLLHLSPQYPHNQTREALLFLICWFR